MIIDKIHLSASKGSSQSSARVSNKMSMCSASSEPLVYRVVRKNTPKNRKRSATGSARSKGRYVGPIPLCCPCRSKCVSTCILSGSEAYCGDLSESSSSEFPRSCRKMKTRSVNPWKKAYHSEKPMSNKRSKSGDKNLKLTFRPNPDWVRLMCLVFLI